VPGDALNISCALAGKERMEWNKAMRLQMSAKVDNDNLAEAAE
jgi:hypothetical protein